MAGVTAGEYADGVTFQATNCPAELPRPSPPLPPQSSVLTLSASSTATTGTSTVTISAIGNISSTLEVLLGSTTITLTVNPAAPPPSTCTINYVIQPQNSSAFGATITIDNTGTTALSGWALG